MRLAGALSRHQLGFLAGEPGPARDRPAGAVLRRSGKAQPLRNRLSGGDVIDQRCCPAGQRTPFIVEIIDKLRRDIAQRIGFEGPAIFAGGAVQLMVADQDTAAGICRVREGGHAVMG